MVNLLKFSISKSNWNFFSRYHKSSSHKDHIFVETESKDKIHIIHYFICRQNKEQNFEYISKISLLTSFSENIEGLLYRWSRQTKMSKYMNIAAAPINPTVL